MDGYFSPHPLNPIVIDPSRARMAGGIIFRSGRYYRYGQNNVCSYGDGITICEIIKLTKKEYQEVFIGSLSFDAAKGPHTINFSGDICVVDFYIEKVSIFAWYRRLTPLLMSKIMFLSPSLISRLLKNGNL